MLNKVKRIVRVRAGEVVHGIEVEGGFMGNKLEVDCVVLEDKHGRSMYLPLTDIARLALREVGSRNTGEFEAEFGDFDGTKKEESDKNTT